MGSGSAKYNELVDSLVLRGYITRNIDPKDGKASFTLTERGRAAAEAIREASRIVDEELERRLSEADITGLRRGLLALAEIKQSLQKP